MTQRLSHQEVYIFLVITLDILTGNHKPYYLQHGLAATSKAYEDASAGPSGETLPAIVAAAMRFLGINHATYRMIRNRLRSIFKDCVHGYYEKESAVFAARFNLEARLYPSLPMSLPWITQHELSTDMGVMEFNCNGDHKVLQVRNVCMHRLVMKFDLSSNLYGVVCEYEFIEAGAVSMIWISRQAAPAADHTLAIHCVPELAGRTDPYIAWISSPVSSKVGVHLLAE